MSLTHLSTCACFPWRVSLPSDRRLISRLLLNRFLYLTRHLRCWRWKIIGIDDFDQLLNDLHLTEEEIARRGQGPVALQDRKASKPSRYTKGTQVD